MTTSERPGWDLPAAPRQKKITTTVLLFLSVPQPSGLSTTMAIVAILSCDGNDIIIHLMSTIHINILGYRIIHVLRMKIIIIKKKVSRLFFLSPVPKDAFYEVKDHGVYGHRYFVLMHNYFSLFVVLTGIAPEKNQRKKQQATLGKKIHLSLWHHWKYQLHVWKPQEESDW